MEDKYELGAEIGGGSFGTVRKGREKATGKKIAEKCITSAVGSSDEDSSGRRVSLGAFREIMSLVRVLGPHKNVVHVMDVFARGSSVSLVMELADTDLGAVLGTRFELRESFVKYVVQEILHGVAYCHSMGIMHRDLKPSNVLMFFDGRVKLADFGMARSFLKPRQKTESSLGMDEAPVGRQKFSHQVTTRWYRAPELLLGSRYYDEMIDLWSVGVITGEMLLGCTLFPGENDIDQLYKIMQVLGSIDDRILSEDMYNPEDAKKIEFPHMDPVPEYFESSDASPELMDCAKRMLSYSPARRGPAESILREDAFFLDPLPSFDGQVLLTILAQKALRDRGQD